MLFDWLGSDDTPPLGVMALWPLSSAFFFADAFVFEAISRRYWLPGFWRHNLWAVATEVVMLAPVAAPCACWRGRPRPQRRASSRRVSAGVGRRAAAELGEKYSPTVLASVSAWPSYFHVRL